MRSLHFVIYKWPIDCTARLFDFYSQKIHRLAHMVIIGMCVNGKCECN